MWPNLKNMMKALPANSRLLCSRDTDGGHMVCRAVPINRESVPGRASVYQMIFAEPEELSGLLQGELRYPQISALLTRESVTSQMIESLLLRETPLVLIDNQTPLAELAVRCNEYILNYVSRSFFGELTRSEWPDFSALYFSSHFEDILNGMQYVDSSGFFSSEQPFVFPRSPYVLLTLQIEPAQDTREDAGTTLSKVLEHLDQEAMVQYANVRIPISVRNNSSVVCLLSADDRNTVLQQREKLQRFVGKVRGRCMASGIRAVLSAAYSDSFPDFGYIYFNYKETLFSIALYRDLYGGGNSICTSDMNLYFHLLRRLDFPSITYTYDRYWSALQEYDRKNKSDLCNTLDTYLKCNGKNVEAAAILDIHRNTMHNRLCSIEKLLAINLSDPETVFRLGVCFKLKAIMKASSQSSYLFTEHSGTLPHGSISIPLDKEIAIAYEILNRHDASSDSVLSLLRSHGLTNVSVKRVEVNDVYSDFIRILIPGVSGKTYGMSSPTIGVVGRLSGIKMENLPLSLVSDADGAIAAIALALRLAALHGSNEGPLGDVIITTQIALQSSAKIHLPAALTSSPIDTRVACMHEVDPDMDAVISIAVCRATRWVNADGIAVTPTVKDGYILPPCDSLLNILETVTGRLPVVFPLTTYDITPIDNGLYHVNSIIQPSLATGSPVIGVALTSVNLVPGITLRHNDLSDVGLATRFTLEVVFGFTSGSLQFYDAQELRQAKAKYGQTDYTAPHAER